MPRAAVLSIHARVEGTAPDTWEDPSLVQLWGPRFSVYVVPARDHAASRSAGSPRTPGGDAWPRTRPRLEAFLGGRGWPTARPATGSAKTRTPAIRRTTGRVLIRWEGASADDLDGAATGGRPREARLELARRYLHVFGPATPAGSPVGRDRAGGGRAAFDELAGSLTPARTPVGEAWILTGDEPMFRAPGGPAAPARLLPSGDAYSLLQGADRELLVPTPVTARELWTPRVWPGAVLVGGDIVGTWRRAQADVTIASWRRLSRAEREAVEAEAAALPVPGLKEARARPVGRVKKKGGKKKKKRGGGC